MLHLQSATPKRWLDQVDAHLDQILIDHALCEKKAAATAMKLITAYTEHEELCREMAQIVNEELEHFQMVRDLLNARNICFRRLPPGGYGRKLYDLIRRREPLRAVDRLLVAGLIEARSCERFGLLQDHIEDAELAAFYGSLFEAEARHHATYVRLAKTFGKEKEVERRLEELGKAEAQIIAEGDERPRMHS